MDSIANLRERVEVVEQQINVMGAPISLVNQRPGGWRLSWRVAAIAALGLALAFPHGVQAKTFRCGAGDVPCLIAAINEANANGDSQYHPVGCGDLHADGGRQQRPQRWPPGDYQPADHHRPGGRHHHY